MKRKRAIKLLMAMDGNGQRSAAAKLLDIYRKQYRTDNEGAVRKARLQIIIMTIRLGEYKDFIRATSVHVCRSRRQKVTTHE